jgi:hypothetical protein
MDVIFDTADNDWLTVEVGKYSSQVPVKFVAMRGFVEVLATIFCREHQMDQNLREGLRHAKVNVRFSPTLFNPFRVENRYGLFQG